MGATGLPLVSTVGKMTLEHQTFQSVRSSISPDIRHDAITSGLIVM